MSNGLGIIRDGLSHGLANAAAAQAGAKFCFRTPIKGGGYYSHSTLKVKI